MELSLYATFPYTQAIHIPFQPWKLWGLGMTNVYVVPLTKSWITKVFCSLFWWWQYTCQAEPCVLSIIQRKLDQQYKSNLIPYKTRIERIDYTNDIRYTFLIYMFISFTMPVERKPFAKMMAVDFTHCLMRYPRIGTLCWVHSVESWWSVL